MENSNNNKKDKKKKTTEEEIFSAPTEVLPPSSFLPKLIVIKGERSGQEIAINKESMSIGRDLKADIKIRDTSVSKRHAVLFLKGDEVYIKDLNSANGTYVNGEKILPNKEIALKNGDKIEIGKNQYEFESIALEEKEFGAETEILPGQLIGKFEVLKGNIPFSDYDVRSGAVIGKSKDCDIYIPDNFVSNEHAKITFIDGKTYITDLESSNGTFINGKQIPAHEPRELNQNDKIKIGGVELKFEYFKTGAEFEVGTQYDIRKTFGKLKAISGSILGWEYDVRHGLTFGRDEDNDVVIPSSLASSKHAKIEVINNKPYIVDLESKNGTKVNKKNIKRKALYGGDKVEIGDVTFQYIGKKSVVKTWVPVGTGIAVVIGAIIIGFLMYRASNNRKLANSYINMANVFFSEKRFDQAQNELQKALKINPKHSEALTLLEEVKKRKEIIVHLNKAKDALEKEFFEDAKKNCDEILYNLQPENKEAKQLKETILRAESQKKETTTFFTDIEKSIGSKNYDEAIFLADIMLERNFDPKYKKYAESLKERAMKLKAEDEKIKALTKTARIKELEKAIQRKYNSQLFALAQEDIKRLLTLDPNNQIAIRYSQMIENQLNLISTQEKHMRQEVQIREIPSISAENIVLAEKLMQEANKIELDFLDYGKDIQPALEKWQRIKELIQDKNHSLYIQADMKIKKYSR